MGGTLLRIERSEGTLTPGAAGPVDPLRALRLTSNGCGTHPERLGMGAAPIRIDRVGAAPIPPGFEWAARSFGAGFGWGAGMGAPCSG
jgi:hypothetical protein